MPHRLAISDATTALACSPAPTPTQRKAVHADQLLISDSNPQAAALFGYEEDELEALGPGVLAHILGTATTSTTSTTDSAVAWLLARFNDILASTLHRAETIRVPPGTTHIACRRKDGSAFTAAVEAHALEYIYPAPAEGGESTCRPGMMLVFHYTPPETIVTLSPPSRPLSASSSCEDGMITARTLSRVSSASSFCELPKNRGPRELRARFKGMFEGACSAIGKGFFDIALQNLGAWSNFEYAFIAAAIPSGGVDADGHHKMLRVMSFWDRKTGVNPAFASVPYASHGSPCYLTFKSPTVHIPTALSSLYPDFPFFQLLSPPPKVYIALAINDTETGGFIGNIGLMDVRDPDEAVDGEELEYIKLGMRVFAERVGAELKRGLMEDGLREAREQADLASREKTQFLNHMSHEIRTPMNACLGMSELLLDTHPLTPTQLDYITTIHTAGQHLLRVINNTLDLSKIEAGCFTLAHQSLNLPALLNDAANLVRPLPARLTGDAEQVDVNWAIAEDVPHWVMGDETRVKQIVVNLVGNAVKFCGGGGRVEVGVAVEKGGIPMSDGDGGGGGGGGVSPLVVKFSVKDTGCGIPTHQIPALFRPFTQLAATAHLNHRGSGLGLAIAQHLVLLMHGRIWVESSIVGGGTTICFSVPFAPAHGGGGLSNTPAGSMTTSHEQGYMHTTRSVFLESNPTNAPPLTPPADSPSEQPYHRHWDPHLSTRLPFRILVAEDNPVNARMVLSMFAKLGYGDVAWVRDGEEMVRVVAGRYMQQGPDLPFEVVFTDLQMPVMDGFKATETLLAFFTTLHDSIQQQQQQQQHPTIIPQIIGLSANASTESRARCLECGMRDYVTKPVGIRDLQDALGRCWERGARVNGEEPSSARMR
ncbi:uncharacterized protein EV422DRAFT_509077 [Fimicolochytrium jonesii]|uniref:uncharacterized protein n=1 Tax=Fimicolochytrium jonesii TaxID=1396493 RepID=UPI0022FEF632|nr:uncharacterized protein EV422DRAFT_509077 [Fimicolochytrium jonesii]KAI8817237.1 hypothetical protein EV422DRAFT_509077 [Fimicolochytrium jonesii]